jgi:pyridoxal phosphate enzyme (YggS family)
MSALQDNLDSIRRRIAAACERSNRHPDSVHLIVVTKNVPADVVARLPALGVSVVGENRVQEAAEKIPQIQGLRWHLIGSLQTNKAKKAMKLFEAIHSVDRWELVEALTEPTRVFVQVNIAGEASKHGLRPGDVESFVSRLRRTRHTILGLMTMPPISDDPEASRPLFRKLAQIARESGLTGLSMGMSQDFDVAVEEGATHVRIGTAIFKGAL